MSPRHRDLWIDGRVYDVPAEVKAHCDFLSDCNARLAEAAARGARQAAELRRENAALKARLQERAV